MKDNNEQGYTLIEVVAVLSIVGVLMMSMSMVVSSMFTRYKTNRIQDQLITLHKAVNQRFVADGNYGRAKTSFLIDEEVIPADMVNDDELVVALGKGEVLSGNTTFRIRFSELPLTACINLALMSWVSQDTSDLVSMKINNKTFNWPRKAANADSSMPITAGVASTTCQRGDNNTITWEFQ